LGGFWIPNDGEVAAGPLVDEQREWPPAAHYWMGRHFRCPAASFDNRSAISASRPSARHISYDVIDDDPPRSWAFGFTAKGVLIELIVLHKAKEDLVIHCMKARKAELDKALLIRGGRY